MIFTDESKWCKGKLYCRDAYGDVIQSCLIGALLAAELIPADVFFRTNDFEKGLLAIIRRRWPERTGGLGAFNDHADTTFADIQSLLQEAGV